MNASLPISIILGALFVCCFETAVFSEDRTSKASTDPEQSEKAVQEILDRFGYHWNNDQANELCQMFMSDGEFLSPSGKNAHSRAEIKKLISQERHETFKESSLETTIQEVHFPREGLAEVKGQYELKGLSFGLGIMDISSDGRFLFKLQKLEGKWMISHARIKS